jgi:hypothetical protein
VEGDERAGRAYEAMAKTLGKRIKKLNSDFAAGQPPHKEFIDRLVADLIWRHAVTH